MPQNYADIREKLLLRLRNLEFTESTTKKEIKRVEAVLSSISNIADRKRQQNHAAAALLREVRERERERERERARARERARERERERERMPAERERHRDRKHRLF
jgi:CHASE3 domain sensor protein